MSQSTHYNNDRQQQQSMQESLEILEYINMGITFVFLILYVYRLIHLRHFAITQRYNSKYPKTRIILCLPYVILSIPFLAFSIVEADQTTYSTFWLIQFGIGECIDAIILIIQLFVLRQQLNKQRPYTPIHLLFCIYLTIISIIRLICVLLITDKKTGTFIFMAFYLAFLINAVLLLGYWIAKRQELPEFEKHSYFNFSQFQNLNNTRYLNRNIQISYLRKASQSFNYIRPTVSVEKGKFRIVLQVYDRDLEPSNIDGKAKTEVQHRSTLKIGHISSRLKIISNNLYSMNQILELYKICGRFSISQKLFFDSHNLGEMYKNLQNYLDQLFANKKNYMKSMLKFFEVPEDFLQGFERALRQTFKDSEMDIYANMDKNAAIISVNVFKQLWIDDYYLFYMDVLAIDGKFQSCPMRRYNDFQMFHSQLQGIIKRRYGGKYVLPNLPKKYLFNWDQSKITQRRNQLEAYLRSLTNDYKLMLEFHEVRQATLQFLGFFEVITLQPVCQQFKSFYKNIQVFKGSISKQLTNSEYVTFYEFKILYNGIPIRTIKKRFNDFVILHQNMDRWMANTQISYKFLVLPEKHLIKSGTVRHQKLRAYLEALIKIQDVWKIYQVNAFLQVGNNTIRDISMSGIQSPDQEFRTKKNLGINSQDDNQIMTQRFIDEQSFESKGRMSALIEQLGNN